MICRSCSLDKPESEFYRNKAIARGFDYKCKACRLEYTAKWAKTEAGAKCRKLARRSFYLSNKDYELAKSRQWRNGKRLGTPSWLTKEQLQEIENIYFLARDCKVTTGEPYEVDHIVPINGKDVCGLHVPWNLQVLPRDINSSKSNKTMLS